MLHACQRATADGQSDLDFFRLDKESFAACPSDSIDYAVMKHADNVAMIPVDMDWSDVGSWAALWEVAQRDEDGNALIGDVMSSRKKSRSLCPSAVAR